MPYSFGHFCKALVILTAVGMALDGSIIAVSDDSNAAYYGKPVRPTDIIVKHSVSNPKSADLRTAAAKLMQ
jgi:SH3 domain-containing YSC84-like protein 1